MDKPAFLVLEDGTIFRGKSIGADGYSVGEVVFNTSLTGYQEILSDPSYARQIITLTYPHIGNVGMNTDDDESGQPQASGLIIRQLSKLHSSWRSEGSLRDYLIEKNVVGISDIDTRKLTRILRDKGAQKGCLVAGDALSTDDALAQAHSFAGLAGMDLAKEVTVHEPYQWTQGVWQVTADAAKSAEPRFHVVAYDFGVKRNILKLLVNRGCKVTVVPAQTSASDVLAYQPDGVFLSNGPGDPEPCDYAIQAISELLEKKIPLFGICLGHQLLALASGARTQKMKFGHHGGNHPVQDIRTGQVMISSQNHGFAVDESSLPEHLEATHRSLFDGSLQGISHRYQPAIGFQGHPEASPGPHDVVSLFDQFIDLMQASNA